MPRALIGHADEILHNRGLTETSTMTSWTRNRAIAAQRAGPEGVVLEYKTGLPPPNAGWRFKWSDDIYFEEELLIEGTLHGATVTKP